MHAVHVLLEQPTPRSRQAVEWVLKTMLGSEIRWEDSKATLAAADGPRLQVGQDPIAGAFHVRPSGWLSATGTERFEPPVSSWQGLPTLFPVDSADLPFDVFAATFYQLSRYEEWSRLTMDEHDRPLTMELFASRHGYLDRPIVDEWAIRFAEQWKRSDPSFEVPVRKYRQHITLDLDNGFKYLGRPLWRTLGSTFRDMLRGHFADIAERTSVLRGTRPDPYIIDDELRSLFRNSAERIAFFVLTSDRGQWDHAVPVEDPAYSNMLRDLATWAQPGVHPSYYSSVRKGLMAMEVRRLEKTLERPIEISRQHFLRLRIPETFRELEACGVKEDHSMGIHDQLGFRCGTCTPYPWYDLEQERATALMVHPFAVMDNTLREKLKLSPDSTVDAVRPVINKVKAVGGTFTGLWHESFLARTGPQAAWRDVIMRIIEAARP